MADTTDYKQLAFKLQSDIDMMKWEQAQKDIPFLEEMKARAINAFDKKDVGEKEMLFKMLNDWIVELKAIN